MSTTLYDTIRKIVQQELARVRTAELAVVQAVHPTDPDNYSCTVVLRDSDMVLKQVPLTTPRKGVAMVPDVGDLVLVQFIGGQINAPVITGSLYNDEDRPPKNAEKQAVIHLPADAGDSDAVHIELNTDSAKSVVLNIGDALKLTLIDDDPVVKIDVGGGKATLSIARDGSVQLESGNALSLKASADIKIEAGGQLNLKGSVINLN